MGEIHHALALCDLGGNRGRQTDPVQGGWTGICELRSDCGHLDYGVSSSPYNALFTEEGDTRQDAIRGAVPPDRVIEPSRLGIKPHPDQKELTDPFSM